MIKNVCLNKATWIICYSFAWHIFCVGSQWSRSWLVEGPWKESNRTSNLRDNVSPVLLWYTLWTLIQKTAHSVLKPNGQEFQVFKPLRGTKLRPTMNHVRHHMRQSMKKHVGYYHQRFHMKSLWDFALLYHVTYCGHLTQDVSWGFKLLGSLFKTAL